MGSQQDNKYKRARAMLRFIVASAVVFCCVLGKKGQGLEVKTLTGKAPIDCSNQPIVGLEYFECQPCKHLECPFNVLPPKCNKMCHTPGCYCPSNKVVIKGRCRNPARCNCTTKEECLEMHGKNPITFVEYTPPTESTVDLTTEDNATESFTKGPPAGGIDEESGDPTPTMAAAPK